MIVLSLFDGISCGQVALNRANIPYTKYYASEVDKYAITITQANYPNTIQLGDVTKWEEWNSFNWGDVDLLLGGFPCQAFSVAGLQKGFDDPRGQLFFAMIAIRDNINKHRSSQGKPPVKFLFENVKMSPTIEGHINKIVGISPMLINSDLVSAQLRKRNYWFNWDAVMPKDKGITLQDVILHGEVDRDKSYCIDSSYYKGGRRESLY